MTKLTKFVEWTYLLLQLSQNDDECLALFKRIWYAVFWQLITTSEKR